MPKHSYNENPEGVSAVWREFHKLQKELRDELEGFRKEISRPRFGSRLWAERKWLVPTVVPLFLAIVSGVWYIGGRLLSQEINTAVSPLSEKIENLSGEVSTLRAEIALQKYGTLPTTELRSHTAELRGIQTTLATVNHDVPNFWPVSFQAINLLSQATFSSTVTDQEEAILSNVASNPAGLIGPIVNQRVLLENRVAGITFRNSIVRFDPSVRLANDTFIDCVFIFPQSMQTPPQPLQEIGAALLTSDISKATITTS